MEPPRCANCQATGRHVCKECRIVLYCNSRCQRDHWSVHKEHCESPLSKPDWKPSWFHENRLPDFVDLPDRPRRPSFGIKDKWLIGEIPAIDILKLTSNEGVGFASDLCLLFPASGDLRNVIKTIAAVPTGFAHRMGACINDKDFDVAARNAIILLIAFLIDDIERAVDCMIHTWYSAMICPDQQDVLSRMIYGVLEHANAQFGENLPNDLRRYTWRCCSSCLQVVFTQQQWKRLLNYCKVPEGLTAARAQSMRTSLTLAWDDRDRRELWLLQQPPIQRVAHMKYRKDGMLLPFGHSREPFDQPNPTFFPLGEWPLGVTMNPLRGWSFDDVSRTPNGSATNDVYGKLYNYLKVLFTEFHCRLRSSKIHLELFNINALDLGAYVNDDVFARVDATNLSDRCYLGPVKAVRYLGYFLQLPNSNPHATMICRSSTAMCEMSAMESPEQAKKNFKADLTKVLQYLPLEKKMPQSRDDLKDPGFLLRDQARPMVRDQESLFQKYVEMFKLKDIERFFSFAMKENHTIIEAWPLRLKKQPSEEGAADEFKHLLATVGFGAERYVEWKRFTRTEHDG